MSTATRTVLFTDLADYTGRVSRSDREGLRRILAEHEVVVRPLVEASHGRIVKNIGDSFLCAFPSATDALSATLAIFAHASSNRGAEIRMALSTGDVEEIEGDVFGTSVNIAARILELTPAGECWFSAGTRVCMNETEVPWESVGRFSVKGLAEEQDCFRLVPPDRAWLPQRIEEAIESRCLVRMAPGDRVPTLPADPVILFERFEPGSAELNLAMANLPVLEPQAFYMAAYNINSAARLAWVGAGHGLVVGTPEAVDEAIVAVRDQTATQGADTFSLDTEETLLISRARRADLQMVICGLALPQVPFSNIVASYSYDLLADGRWVTRSTRALLRITVDAEGVAVTALQRDCSLGGAVLPPGETRRLRDRTTLSTSVGLIEFVPTARYAGVLLRDTDMRLALRRGQTGELGRNPASPGLAFPNRPGQDNIRWCSGARAESARANGFTLDRVLAGRQQASIEVHPEGLRLTPLHGECPTYVMRDGHLGQARKAVRVSYGDLVVAGTTVVALRRPE